MLPVQCNSKYMRCQCSSTSCHYLIASCRFHGGLTNPYKTVDVGCVPIDKGFYIVKLKIIMVFTLDRKRMWQHKHHNVNPAKAALCFQNQIARFFLFFFLYGAFEGTFERKVTIRPFARITQSVHTGSNLLLIMDSNDSQPL